MNAINFTFRFHDYSCVFKYHQHKNLKKQNNYNMSGDIDIESLKKYLLNIQKSTIFK